MNLPRRVVLRVAGFGSSDAIAPLIALLLALSGCSTAVTTPSIGLFRAADGALVELHVSPDQQIRGYLREGSRVAALSSVRLSGSTVNTSAVYDDGTRA